jgi:hypothetical protein
MTFAPGTSKPESLYERLRKLSCLTGLPVPFLTLSIKTYDQDGAESSSQSVRSRTFNRNFWNLIFASISSYPHVVQGFLSIKNTDGVAISNLTLPMRLLFSGGYGQYTGIVVGTGSAPEDFNGIALDQVVPYGFNAYELNYYEHRPTITEYVPEDSMWTITISRMFSNNQSLGLIIKEVGLYMPFEGTTETAMIVRDVLANPVAIAGSGTFIVSYIFQLTYPA